MPSMNVCVQCGQPQVVDGVTAPMLHLASKGIHSTAEDMVSYHLDCLPFELEQAHRDQHGPRIDAAKAGVRGDDLRAVADTYEAGFDADDEDQLAAWAEAVREGA